MRAGALALLLIFTACPVPAEERPLWEAGFGIAGLSLPDYRGSRDQREYLFPMPYAVYRGDLIRYDRKGLYGLLFDNDRLQWSVSADANVPVKSDRNNARAGMPDLDATVQIGPALEICLYSNCDADRVLQLVLPIRAVFEVGRNHVRGAGLVVNPQVNVDIKNLGPEGGWNFGFAAGPLYASERYHDYYYEVQPQYALPGERSAYDARGGYSGSLFVVTLSRRYEQSWFWTFCRYDDLSGAVFGDSPLVNASHSWMAGLGLAWIFGKSPDMVNVK